MKLKLYVPKKDNLGKCLIEKIKTLDKILLEYGGFTRISAEGFWKNKNIVYSEGFWKNKNILYKDDIFIYTIFCNIDQKIINEILFYIKIAMRQITVSYEIDSEFKLFKGF